MADWGNQLSQELLKRLGCRWRPSDGRWISPSEPTIRRTLQSVDADELDTELGEWMAEQVDGDAVAVDGKTLRGSTNSEGKAIHLMGALLHKERIVLAQKAVSDKSNEITAFKPLLKSVELDGKVVTADALHAQVEHARFLKEEKSADYVFTVKGNQPGLLSNIELLEGRDFSPSGGSGRKRARSAGDS